jgi:hypothetical protein
VAEREIQARAGAADRLGAWAKPVRTVPADPFNAVTSVS